MPTLDASIGGSTANTYLDLSQAAEFFDGEPAFFSTWIALSSTAQARWLITAARAVDRLGFAGEKLSAGQAREFPRYSPDGETWAVDSNGEEAIPQEVQEAQALTVMDLYSKTEGGASDYLDPLTQVNSLSVAGAVELDLAEQASQTIFAATPAAVKARLRQFRPSTARVVRG